MAIQWGPVAGHMQVGIDVRTSAYDWTTPTIDVYVDYWIRTVAWGFHRDMTVQTYGSFMGPNLGFRIDSNTGETKEQFVGTVTVPGIGPVYGGGPTYGFGGVTTNNNQGPNPSQEVSWAVPAKPPGPPGNPGVSISNISATDALLNVTASDPRGSAVYRYYQEVRTWPAGVLVKAWDGGTGWCGPLVRATNYYATSQAFNGVGPSGLAVVGPFTTLATAPSAIRNLHTVGVATPSSVDLAWDLPLDDGGRAIVGNVIQAATDDAFTQNVVTLVQYTTATTATLTGLVPGLTYKVRAYAGNIVGDPAGNGPWSNIITATTLATNTVKVPGVGWVPVRAWGKIPGLGWRPLTVWKRPAGSGGVYTT